MFTGIITAIGRIDQVAPLGDSADAGVRLRIQAGGLPLDRTRVGDSIAVQGACMTVVALHPDAFEVDVSRESLDRTCGLDAEGEVNLEHALRMGDSLDGHLVSGHVDGVGRVTCLDAVGESLDLRIIVPAHLSRYLAYKGSITVNGVSLTINRVDDQEEGTEISINLIPHTVQVTTLRNVQVGSSVNLEIDLIARYVERMVGGLGVAALAGGSVLG
ncbi:riboflavin synthase [Castellaniella sp.]|uniref:riboflavin synthase n=1 Tax=Castellaniella sp. TaxID=1955812 RepID=UPI0035658BAC